MKCCHMRRSSHLLKRERNALFSFKYYLSHHLLFLIVIFNYSYSNYFLDESIRSQFKPNPLDRVNVLISLRVASCERQVVGDNLSP